jgi:hypothetical protein
VHAEEFALDWVVRGLSLAQVAGRHGLKEHEVARVARGLGLEPRPGGRLLQGLSGGRWVPEGRTLVWVWGESS